MMNFFNELKRRNVFKVGIAYLGLAWLMVEASTTLAPLLRLPEWAPSMVLYLSLIGFPAVLVFSWVYEVTPDGIKLEADIEHEGQLPKANGRTLDFIVIGVMALVIGFLIFDRGAPVDETSIEGAEVKNNTSIAVLPFVNMSSDPEQAYFSDGISEEILNVLAQIPDLHVTSRSSAFQFRGNDIHIPTVAKRLGVAHILEGSVRKSGSTVRITAQLIDAASDKHLWSATYDRELKDIFVIQDEISTAIVGALKETVGVSGVITTLKMSICS